MNKRSLLSFAMCSLLLGSLPVGLVGCKDYDGDIKKLDTTTGNLSSQVSTLQSALDAAKQAADAAANDAKAAAAKADSATQEVALAKQAVEEAKAEAIQTALDAIKDGNFASTDDLAALSGKLEGIETGLSKIQADFTESQKAIAELNKQISAMDVQIKALENLKASVEQLKGDVAAIDGLSEKVAAIDGITAELNQIKADAAATKNAAAANKADVAELKTAVADAKSKLANVSSEISTQVTNAVNSIAGILAQRLTSVTLIPELYVDGIPTLSFEQGTYSVKKWEPNDKLAAKGSYVYELDKNGDLVPDTVNNGEVEAKYRLSPSLITNEDIDIAHLGYYTQIATIRTRAEEPKEVLAISGANVDAEGILTVKLSNSMPDEINLINNKAYTVSLKVPIAKKHLFENETSAEVYSEFTRLQEIKFTPSLGLSYQAKDRGSSYNYGLWSDGNWLLTTGWTNYIVKQVAYDKNYNLNDLLLGRKRVYDPTTAAGLDTIANADLVKYGLGIRYKVPNCKYIPSDVNNGTDQQQYVKLSGKDNCILTPQTPSGATANQAIIGKTPILLAEMYNLEDGTIVDAQYFKIEFSVNDVENIEKTFDITEYEGDACGITHAITWDYMSKNLLETLNGGKGMSQREFIQAYSQWPYVNGLPDQNLIPSATVEPNPTWGDRDIVALTLSADDYNLGLLKIGANQLKYGNVVTFEPSIPGYPKIKLTINWTPTLKVNAATLGDVLASNWTNNTMQIRVMPKDAAHPTAEYATNILSGRIKPYVVDKTLDNAKGEYIIGCTGYQIVYAPVKEQDKDLMEDLDNYCGEPLTFTSSYQQTTFEEYEYPWTNTTQSNLTSVIYKLDKDNESAKLLASKGGKIKVNWNAKLNSYYDYANRLGNFYSIGSIYLDVLPILKYNEKVVATIKPGLTPVTAAMNIVFSDAYNTEVKKGATDGLWDFYGIGNVIFNPSATNYPAYKKQLQGIKIGTGNQTYANATKLTDTAFGVTVAGDKITFSSNGYSVTTASTIYVPFVVEHSWGVLVGQAKVALQVTNGN